jgi:hypothetical protein
MIRAPTGERTAQPLQLNTAAPQNLRSVGTPPYLQGGFLCGGDHPLTAFVRLPDSRTAAERILHGIFQ